jgi:hypothetical protein
MIHNLIIFALLMGNGLCHAAPIKFAPEFTFSSPLMESQTRSATQVSTPEGSRLLHAWKDSISAECGTSRCTVKTSSVKNHEAFKVFFPNGWFMEVSQDPYVLEVTMPKDDNASVRSYRQWPDHFIFELSQRLGLKAHSRIGQNHINIDRETAFGKNHRLFGAFLEDCASHPEWFIGILGNHLGNAPPLLALDDESIYSFEEVMRDFYYYQHSSDWLASQIQQRVYVSHPWRDNEDFFPRRHKKSLLEAFRHYQGLSLRNFSLPTRIEEQRVEWRGNRPDSDLDSYLRKTGFIEARINWLENNLTDQRLNWPRTFRLPAGEAIQRFREDLHVMNLPEEAYLAILDPSFLALAEDPQNDFPLAVDEESLNPTTYRILNNIYRDQTAAGLNLKSKKAQEIGSEERSLKLFPKLLPAEDEQKLLLGSSQRARMLKALTQDMLNVNPKAVAQKIIPAEVFNSIVNYFLAGIPKNWLALPNVGSFYAPDIVRDDKNQLVVMEDNCGSTGGMADATASRLDLLKVMPAYCDVLSANDENNFSKEIVNYISTKTGGKKTLFLFPYDEHSSLHRQIQQFEGAAAEWDYVTTDRIAIKGKNKDILTYTIDGHEEIIGGLVLKSIDYNWFVKKFPLTKKLIDAGKIYLIATLELVPSDKELLAYTDDLIRLYLNEEPILKTIPTYSFTGNSLSILNRIRASPRRFVVKPANGKQGKAVHIGNKIATNWIRLNKSILADPQNWVAQDRVAISKVDNAISDFRTFQVIMGNGEIIQGPHFWSRGLKTWGDGRLNLSAEMGAKAVPVFHNNDIKYKNLLQELELSTSAEGVIRFLSDHQNLGDAAALKLVRLQPSLSQLNFALSLVRRTRSASLILLEAGKTQADASEFASFLDTWRTQKLKLSESDLLIGRKTVKRNLNWPPLQRFIQRYLANQVTTDFVDADLQLEQAFLRMIELMNGKLLNGIEINPHDFKTNSDIRFSVASHLIEVSETNSRIDHISAKWNLVLDVFQRRRLYDIAERRREALRSSALRTTYDHVSYGSNVDQLGCEKSLN